MHQLLQLKKQKNNQQRVKAEVVNTEVKAPEAALKDSEVEAALSLKNIKYTDGKYYYVNEDGSHKENFAITVNGQLLYFGKDGALTSSSTHSFTPGTQILLMVSQSITVPTIHLKQVLN